MEKVIKLSPLYRENSNRKFIPVPSLRLSGKWLEREGFHMSKTVHVAVQDGKMIITAID
jgi:hypothetical protein